MTAPLRFDTSNDADRDRALTLLRCPETRLPLVQQSGRLWTSDRCRSYAISPSGIPLFAERFCSADARAQQAHYDAIAKIYGENLAYPHTQEYMAYLDRALFAAIANRPLGVAAEICCGSGEAFQLLGDRIECGVGVDVSLSMLEAAQQHCPETKFAFVQGDATSLPLADAAFDSVIMLGGIHHVRERRQLFAEVERILKPGGWFYFREPVSDFLPWRALRWVIYRLSPTLDHETERPLLWRETAPVLAEAGLSCERWTTHGFLGFCIFMNSDVLVFNRLFRFLPGIRALTRLAARLDATALRLPGLHGAGLQVVGAARKPG